MASEPITGYARSGAVHIAYQVTGEGPLDLLLVPDGVIPIEAMLEEPSFERFILRLGRFCRVIRFDRRGMGLSDPVTPASPPTLEQWMGDAEAVLGTVRSERTALLGMAEGGFVVSLLAATRPQRVAALVLVNATPGFTAEPFRRWGLAADALDRLGGENRDRVGASGVGDPFVRPERRGRRPLPRVARACLAPVAQSGHGHRAIRRAVL